MPPQRRFGQRRTSQLGRGDKDILRLQIPMDDMQRMQELQSTRNLRQSILFREIFARKDGELIVVWMSNDFFEGCGTKLERYIDELVISFICVVSYNIGVFIAFAQVVYFLFCELEVFELHSFYGDTDSFPSSFVDESSLASAAYNTY